MKLYLIDAVHELRRILCKTSDQFSSKFTFYLSYFTYTSKSSNQFLVSRFWIAIMKHHRGQRYQFSMIQDPFINNTTFKTMQLLFYYLRHSDAVYFKRCVQKSWENILFSTNKMPENLLCKSYFLKF